MQTAVFILDTKLVLLLTSESPRLTKYHDNYLISTNDVCQCNDSVTPDNAHIIINHYS